MVCWVDCGKWRSETIASATSSSSRIEPILIELKGFEACDVALPPGPLVADSILATGEDGVVYGQPDRGWPSRGRLHFVHTGFLRLGVVLVLTLLIEALIAF